jgi:acetoacetyl-CoA reductase
MGQANYSAAKAGDIGFVKALAQEGAGQGHHRQRHLPGLHRHRDGEGHSAGRAGQAHPAADSGGPPGRARGDRAGGVFLASDEAGFITGSTISANGGQYMM